MEEKKIIKIKLKTVTFLVILFIVVAVATALILFNKNNSSLNIKYIKIDEKIQNGSSKEYAEKKQSESIKVNSSLIDETTTNCIWCGTFQLVWNDMINNIIKQNVEFIKEDGVKDLEIAQKVANNLDKQVFTEKDLSENSYFKVFDLKTLDLKKKIEEAIKTKFGESSEILDNIDWSDAPEDNSYYDGKDEKEYIFYTMLKKVFNFKNNFDELENSSFANKYMNIKYFGIDKKSDAKLYSQVDVLYYKDINDFAVILNTVEEEQVILARGLKGNNFVLMYNDLVTKTNEYKGNKEFTENDYLKVPNIKLNSESTFNELYEKHFFDKNGYICEILAAIQTIELDMDKSGGKIKSEAIIHTYILGAAKVVDEPVIENRYFYLDDEFTMFLKEKEKDIPYFAANIADITLFQ